MIELINRLRFVPENSSTEVINNDLSIAQEAYNNLKEISLDEENTALNLDQFLTNIQQIFLIYKRAGIEDPKIDGKIKKILDELYEFADDFQNNPEKEIKYPIKSIFNESKAEFSRMVDLIKESIEGTNKRYVLNLYLFIILLVITIGLLFFVNNR